jgi:hypothetical protein
LIGELLPHTILKADLVLLADCSNFDAEAVDDGEDTVGTSSEKRRR